MDRKKLPLIFLLLLLVAAGCSPVATETPGPGPREHERALNATQHANQQIIRLTDMAEIDATQAAEKTAVARETQTEKDIRVIQAEWQAGREAFETEARRQDQEYLERQRALDLQIVADNATREAQLTATPARATEVAIGSAIRREEFRSYWIDPIREMFPWIVLGLVVLAVLVALGVGGYELWQAWRQDWRPALRGRLLTVLVGPLVVRLSPDGLGIDLIKPGQMFEPGYRLNPGGHQQAGGVAPRLQEPVTERAQWIEGIRAAGGGKPPDPPSGNGSPPPAGDFAELAGRGLVLGVSERGPVVLDPERQAHLLVAGTTESGKTRFLLRPLVAEALGAGFQVAIYGQDHLDFVPFRDHPNAALVRLSEPAEAIDYLAALFEEIRRRKALLEGAGVSTWGRLPAGEPRAVAVLDEFSNLADALEPREREALWRWTRMIAAEGRKTGVHLVLALQDPTHKSIDLRIRRNCTPVAFRVLDDAASRVVLNAPGAETLGPREFIVRIGPDLVRGRAFHPDDGELQRFLAGRAAPALPAPEWLQLAPGPEPEETVLSPERVAQIRELAGQGWSSRQIELRVFGYAGGQAYEWVKQALSSITTAAKNPPDPENSGGYSNSSKKSGLG